jgi:hypothetical protein
MAKGGESLESEKKAYSPPRLIVHGRVEEITLSSNQINSDVPQGTADTAFPVRTS